MATNGSIEVSIQIIPEKLDLPILGCSSPNSSIISPISSHASSSRCLLHVTIKFKIDSPILFCLLLLFLIHCQPLRLWLTLPSQKFSLHLIGCHSLRIVLQFPLNHQMRIAQKSLHWYLQVIYIFPKVK